MNFILCIFSLMPIIPMNEEDFDSITKSMKIHNFLEFYDMKININPDGKSKLYEPFWMYSAHFHLKKTIA